MNYQKELDKLLVKIKIDNKRPKLLLHACCAPCSSYVLEYLDEYFDITILYYNPNIYPKIEYNRRFDELKHFLLQFKPHIKIIELDYIDKDYYTAIKGLEKLGERSQRCYNCYLFRMREAAKIAKQKHFDYFTTTLSISPYKDAKWINEIGLLLEKEYKINYLYADFKKNNGYKRSLELSKLFKAS